MRFLLACGGTAGHINPAIAVADALRQLLPDCEILFAGSGRPLEKRLIPAAGYELTNIEMRGLERGFSPKKLGRNAKAAAMLLTASRRADKLIKSFAPDAAIGTGGYICYPVLRAAAKAGIPTVMHESNVRPGLTVKLLSGIVMRVYAAFPGAEDEYRNPGRVYALATPVSPSFSRYTRGRARREMGIPDDIPVVVSFWGSLGASGMNAMMPEFIGRNLRDGAFRHIHAVGSDAGAEALKNAVSPDGALSELEDIRAYIDDMPRVMAAADLVLCRAGGSTLAELSALGRAAVLIPSPYVANDEQTLNAGAVVRAGGAVRVTEAESTGGTLYETVTELLREPGRISQMEERQRGLGAADAAERLAEEIISML
ncbi:MAG: UDP-N-acetylglucosamine--N-acetylmuramyl-(pentapeptide) pyrophosphoryl-undecaprenol N-acetylglucosamine transferase [Oscillospiraceae bacterium]|nr:UDP-N-acetylglucosamine--N-acetylmuramyl-(pentapeptide) pyrophosphoryl-undecaprenol N-acetylglucosamine transferase [Oscillospiraceae bacterium]